MQYSGKSKKNLKKFLYMNKVNSKEQEKSSSEVNNNLNASDSEERKNLFEYSNLKKNINENFKDFDEKYILNELVKEGIITIDEEDKERNEYDLKDMKLKEVDIEKLMMKLININKSFNHIKHQNHELRSSQKTISHKNNTSERNNSNSYKNDISNSESLSLRNKDSFEQKNIVKIYEKDLNYFSDMIKSNFEEFL